MRHAADALATGVGTILADNPLLTDRSGLPRRRPLLRIVLDSTLRTPLDSQLVETAHEDVLIFFTHASLAAQQALEARGVRLQQIGQDPPGERLALPHVLETLGRMSITSLLIEGGAQVHTAALNQGLVDKLMLFYAPTFLGDAAVPMLGAINELPRIQQYRLKTFGKDFALEAYLRDPWKDVPGMDKLI